MQELKVLLSTIADVKDFVQIVNQYSYHVDLISDRYIVDGKSIMGIFSLDLTRPLLARINCESDCELISELQRFLHKD
ncbi:MAG: HPr family phosphocarrier protein [Fastidiosipilaceae bacterium]|jgi:phosphocarrier protein HPr